MARAMKAILADSPREAHLRGAASTARLNERLAGLHAEIRAYFPFITRIAVAAYDAPTDDIKTFLCSPLESSPLLHYRTRLADATWLNALHQARQSRVIDDLDAVDLGPRLHSRSIAKAGFKASFTVPIYDDTGLFGFVFFDADRPRVFSSRVTRQLDLFVRIIAMMIENSARAAHTLAGSVQLLRDVSRFRDDETASHLNRMSRYSELIARSMAAELGQDDEWVEQVRLFSPLHDVGKVAIPDAILLKPCGLTAEETLLMRQHAPHGAALLGSLVDKLSLQQTPHIGALLDIARHHHECWDGSGYPHGLRGEHIPIAARIVKVADVFDALTSERCYKPAWPVGEAVSFLRAGRNTLFDARCVDRFVEELPAARAIMERFEEGSSDAA